MEAPKTGRTGNVLRRQYNWEFPQHSLRALSLSIYFSPQRNLYQTDGQQWRGLQLLWGPNSPNSVFPLVPGVDFHSQYNFVRVTATQTSCLS
jgi:hypothetical protein